MIHISDDNLRNRIDALSGVLKDDFREIGMNALIATERIKLYKLHFSDVKYQRLLDVLDIHELDKGRFYKGNMIKVKITNQLSKDDDYHIISEPAHFEAFIKHYHMPHILEFDIIDTRIEEYIDMIIYYWFHKKAKLPFSMRYRLSDKYAPHSTAPTIFAKLDYFFHKFLMENPSGDV